MHHGQNLQCFLRQTLSLRKHCNSWPRSLKSTFVRQVFMLLNLSLVVKKNLHFAYVKTKTQISCAVCAADQHRWFHYTDSTIPPLPIYTKFQASSHLLWLYSLVCVGLVGTPQDRFSHNEAHFVILLLFFFTVCFTVCQKIIKALTHQKNPRRFCMLFFNV